jgi:hypothetical protein
MDHLTLHIQLGNTHHNAYHRIRTAGLDLHRPALLRIRYHQCYQNILNRQYHKYPDKQQDSQFRYAQFALPFGMSREWGIHWDLICQGKMFRLIGSELHKTPDIDFHRIQSERMVARTHPAACSHYHQEFRGKTHHSDHI